MLIKLKNAVLISFVLIVSNCTFAAFERTDIYRIDASNNATRHNNLGMQELEEKNYYAAIEEFNIAISLNPNTPITAVYYNNLGETYMRLSNYKDAQTCFERAIQLNNLNLLFYQNLARSFKAQKILPAKINEYKIKSTKNSLSKIILGLCYFENGQMRNAIITLDEFCMSEPDLIITSAVKPFVKELAEKMK